MEYKSLSLFSIRFYIFPLAVYGIDTNAILGDLPIFIKSSLRQFPIKIFCVRF